MNSESELSNDQLLQMKLIAGGLLAGPVLFFFVVLFMASQAGSELPGKDRVHTLQLLTGLSLAVGAMVNLAGLCIPNVTAKFLKSTDEKWLSHVQVIHAGMLIRYSLSEGPALFGLVVIFLGSRLKVMPHYIWLNLFSFIILCVVIISTFPTRERVEQLLVQQSTEH